MTSIERKLYKKGKKLAKFASKHGFEYVHVGVMSPDKFCDKWFIDVTVHKDGGNISLGEYVKEVEL